jgi:hypothetical protein
MVHHRIPAENSFVTAPHASPNVGGPPLLGGFAPGARRVPIIKPAAQHVVIDTLLINVIGNSL